MATIKYWDGSAWQYAVVGKQGPVGATGPTGPVGATGATGATGPSALTTKGDIATFSTTTTRLAVGANGETLVADSSASVGLRYQEPKAQQPLINSAFQVWQRGTSIALTTSAYTADRWQGFRNTTGSTVSRQLTNDTTNLPNIQYCARVQRDSGNTSTTAYYIGQSLETADSIAFAGKTITFSFYARAGANYSQTSNGLGVRLRTGTGTDQNVLTAGYTGSVSLIQQTATLTTTWQRFSYTATVATNVTEIGFFFESNPTGTAGANDWFEITGVQLEAGSVATPFRTYAATLAGELAACQRYYYRTNPGSNAYGRIGWARASSTTNLELPVPLPVPMRVAPTAVDYASLTTPTANTVSAAALNQPTTTTGMVDLTSFSLTSGTFYLIIGNNSTSAYIGFSAEL